MEAEAAALALLRGAGSEACDKTRVGCKVWGLGRVGFRVRGLRF